MSRLMSVAYTEQAVVERRKTVTRRLGWWEDKNGRRLCKPGDQITLCRKVMGRRRCCTGGCEFDEPLVRIAEVEVVSVRREPLGKLVFGPYGKREMELEGFPGMDPGEFIGTYFIEAQHIFPDDDITRIEWRYLP